MRHFLSNISTNYVDIRPSRLLRTLHNEADSKAIIDSKIILPILPIISKYVEHFRNDRQWDLNYRFESSSHREFTARPDANLGLDYGDGSRKMLLAVEAKGPGDLDFVTSIEGFRSSDFRELSRQLRKYSTVCLVKNVLVYNEKRGILFEFENFSSRNDTPVHYLLAASGSKANNYRVSMRELLFFAARKALRTTFDLPNEPEANPVRYISVIPTVNRFEERPPLHGRVTRGSVSAGTTAQDIVGVVGRHIFEYYYNPKIRVPRFGIWSPTPIKGCEDSGFESQSSCSRRSVKKFLCEGSLDLIIDVKDKEGRFLFTSNRENLETPSKWSDLRIKMFADDDLLSLANECRAYEKLMDEQGYEIPFCYGTYFGPSGGKMLLLEDVKGITLAERLCEGMSEVEVKDTFFGAWRIMKKIHSREISHGDIRAENILLTKGYSFIVFIDFENSKSIHENFAWEDEDDVIRVFSPYVQDLGREGYLYELLRAGDYTFTAVQ